MIDNENQINTRISSPGGNLPQDRVEGYTILQIEQGLRGARSWNQWRDNMRNMNNATWENIDELFANWY